MGGSQQSRHTAGGTDGGHGANPYFITSVKPGVQAMKNQRQLYRKMDKEMTLVDTFWEGKKSLMKDFEPFKLLDQHAIKTPSHLKGDMADLVQHLIGPAKNPTQKYRVLFRWIAENIAYDVVGLRAGAGVSTAQEALQTGVAVCGGYVDLLKKFCEIAELQFDSVNGYDKGANYYVGHDNLDSCSHAWGLIYLGGKPFYCDPTWAAGNVSKSTNTYTKEWREHWFLAEPNHFENTHLPNDQSETTSRQKDQSLESWNLSPKIGPMMYVMKVSLTQREGVLHANEKNEIDINLKMEVLGSIQHFLTSKSTDFKEDIGYQVMHFWKDNKITLHVRLPGPGTYKLDVYATKTLNASTASEGSEMHDKLVTYTIIGQSAKRNTPLNKRRFGSLPPDVLKGFACVSHTKPIIETSTERVVIEYSCPKDGDLLAKLSTENQPTVALKNRMYHERLKGKHAFHIHLPRAGWYYVYFHNDPKSGQYTQFAVFMIHFTGQSSDTNPVFPEGIKWNPLGIYYESNVKCVSHKSSYIRLTKGEGSLAITRPFQSNCPLKFTLNDINSDKFQKSSQLIFAHSNFGKNDLEKSSVSLRIDEAGFYVLHLFIRQTLAMRWLVVCSKGYDGDLFPPSDDSWGPSWDDFKALDLSMTCDAMVNIPNGQHTLKLALGKKKNLTIVGKLVEANGRENLSYQKAVRVDDSDSKFRDIVINLPDEVNEACLELYGCDKSNGNSFPRIGKWLLIRK
ncbi:hypothetical protein BSL78_11190 [Apostichopus japonicus]|uniref:Uncharacterized protein n=1 Tax=Stichopus japonicus TaxID=307972 RepID=A0A2G8KV70_STIJA|nr:hypothetical protein BSL78_11190 [Apostichopus japonicus]